MGFPNACLSLEYVAMTSMHLLAMPKDIAARTILSNEGPWIHIHGDSKSVKEIFRSVIAVN
jgi:hypothetical protein